ncbi:hypothetical protein [Ornithinibacillus sp. 179-J 7C1 HS]|uniref:hypothetical protein n=1 Tax=Ornithinibacillus sp. 179-J 7C1 HS TaxID=3142384 RepID=UPI0039A156A5
MLKKVFIIVGLLLLAACGNEKGEPKEQVSEVDTDVFANFRNVDIQVERNQAIITGEVNASNNEFYYKAEQGVKSVKKEERVSVDGQWGAFELVVGITEEITSSDEVVIVTMYTKTEDGKIINPNYIPLDLKE